MECGDDTLVVDDSVPADVSALVDDGIGGGGRNLATNCELEASIP